jgi:hypothetical protein
MVFALLRQKALIIAMELEIQLAADLFRQSWAVQMSRS